MAPLLGLQVGRGCLHLFQVLLQLGRDGLEVPGRGRDDLFEGRDRSVRRGISFLRAVMVPAISVVAVMLHGPASDANKIQFQFLSPCLFFFLDTTRRFHGALHDLLRNY